MKKISYLLTLFSVSLILSQGIAQNHNPSNQNTTIVKEEKELILQNDGKVHLYVKRNENGKEEVFEKEYQNLLAAKDDHEFHSGSFEQIKTLSTDLSFDKNDCQYKSIKIIETTDPEQNQLASNRLSNNNNADAKAIRKISVALPKHLPAGFDKLIENNLEVKMLDYFLNPNNGNLTFHIGLIHRKPLEVTVINNKSSEVYKKVYPKSSENIIDEINLSNFSSGIYLLKFRQKNKGLTRKVLIE